MSGENNLHPGGECAPWFTFENLISAAPVEPRLCVGGCGTELEALRRTAGYCKACIARRSSSKRPTGMATELRCRLTVVRMLYRQRIGHREKYVEVQCECGGKRRVLKWATWVHKRPLSCNACRLRGIDRRGFEAEYAR